MLPEGNFFDISDAVKSSLDWVLLTKTMFMLDFAKANEYAFPIPSVEPVTKAHLPAYFCLMFIGDAKKRLHTSDVTFIVNDNKRYTRAHCPARITLESSIRKFIAAL